MKGGIGGAITLADLLKLPMLLKWLNLVNMWWRVVPSITQMLPKISGPAIQPVDAPQGEGGEGLWCHHIGSPTEAANVVEMTEYF